MMNEKDAIKIINTQHQINEGLIMTNKSLMMRVERLERLWNDVEKDLNEIEARLDYNETPTGLSLSGTNPKNRFDL